MSYQSTAVFNPGMSLYILLCFTIYNKLFRNTVDNKISIIMYTKLKAHILPTSNSPEVLDLLFLHILRRAVRSITSIL